MPVSSSGRRLLVQHCRRRSGGSGAFNGSESAQRIAHYKRDVIERNVIQRAV